VVSEPTPPARVVPLPRVVIAAPGSGQGKTTVTTGILAALSREPYGLAVAGFKVGPDYIDPGYHALATGRPGRNLDPIMQGEERIVPLLLHGAATPSPARLAVIEGVMGLYDGRLGADGRGSTAQVAELTDSPVVLVVDISHVSRTVAAVVAGLAAYSEAVRVEGVILNRAGSARHASEVTAALGRLGIPILGVLPRDETITVPSRHLGLVPAAERAESAAALEALAARIGAEVDLGRLVKIALRAPTLEGPAWDPGEALAPYLSRPGDPPGPTPERGLPAARPRIAVAGGRAFTFRYAETTELMEAGGCDVVEFDPLTDVGLPGEVDGLWLGGGFPEVHAEQLAANTPMIASIRAAVDAGTPTVAECAGLLYLCRDVDGHPMVGAIDASAAMTPHLTLGYREADGVTGHEFHRTTITPSDPALPGHVDASYLHVHWAGAPQRAAAFLSAVRDRAADRAGLYHHGDAEVGKGLVDLAVNVRLPHPPRWLAEQIAATLPGLGAYPDASAAREALAALHGVDPAMVLPTSGAAEAFTLVARGAPGRRPVVVHPQFTEPEAALRSAGRPPARLLLTEPFVLGEADPDGDLVIVGNPTNPTSVLHPRAVLADWARPHRVVVVDEAFMDATDEAESVIAPTMDHLLVLRSLTKTWGLAGLRAGYVVGDPELIARLAAQQPPWSVSAPALAAMVACASDRATTEARATVPELAARRDHLIAGLIGLGWRVVTPAAGPFVLADTGDPATRTRLRARGFALRRGDTFPGLGPTWVRVAVRDRAVTDALLEAARG